MNFFKRQFFEDNTDKFLGIKINFELIFLEETFYNVFNKILNFIQKFNFNKN